MTNNPQFTNSIDTGLRLGDIQSIVNSLINNNAASSAYKIIATGTTQGTATPLTCVINEIDTSTSGSGVALPYTKGRINTAYKNCVVINNTANTIVVYPFLGSGDTIGGSTSFALAANSVAVFTSAQGGSWFSVNSSSGGSGNTRVITSVSSNTTAGAAAGTDYVYFATGSITITLPTAIGNTGRYSISNQGSGTITVATSNGQLIDQIGGPATTFINSEQYSSYDFISNGSNWGVF